MVPPQDTNGGLQWNPSVSSGLMRRIIQSNLPGLIGFSLRGCHRMTSDGERMTAALHGAGGERLMYS